MSLNFWELIYRFFNEDHDENQDIIEYQFEGIDDSQCVITAHKEGEAILVINLIEIDQWEMIKDIAEITNAQISDVVKGLSGQEVDQIRLDLGEMNLD
jgi:hypothetical protein